VPAQWRVGEWAAQQATQSEGRGGSTIADGRGGDGEGEAATRSQTEQLCRVPLGQARGTRMAKIREGCFQRVEILLSGVPSEKEDGTHL